MFKVIKRYFKIWLMMARNAFMIWFGRRNLLLMFLMGKIIRYVFYFGFLYFLVAKTNGLAGFSKDQILFFTSTYILVDTLAQFFFRSVYSFRPLVISGDLDLVLLKPIKPLFRVLMGGPDPVDFVTILPILLVSVYMGSLLSPDIIHTVYYVLLVVNGIAIAMAFHIAVLSLGIITLEIDHTIMVYRDLVSMGRLPVDIYKQPLKNILTFVVPVGIMVTLPAKALMGLLSPIGVISALVFGGAILMLSFRFWNFALKKYTSASS